ncbi:hypothetical protein C1645_734722 [Glomus cerebriforme]|uniref:Uncharacterized protein n=1 Tax=Glomus cerebriforme TaxID=658196 RepID=A0A397TI50_9GLOM|nr:hypothetical protein C1645_734722 [Glomus cerebriforme]
MATHEVEVEVVRLTKIMKKYEYLEQRVNLHLFMISILSIIAIILGAGVLIVNDHNDISISSNKKFIDKNSGPDSIPFGTILASISGFFSSGILLFSTYLSTITSKLGKNKDEVYFVVKHFENNGKSYNVGFFNRKPTPMDEFYVEDNNNNVERNSLKNGPPENCQKFTDCLDFMKSLNLTIGEFGIVPGVFRVFLTFDDKFCLNELKRKRNSKTDGNA